MSVSYPLTATARSDAAVSSVEIPQLRIGRIFAVWAAAALPMAALAWVVAPALYDHFAGVGDVPMFKALIVSLAIGMVWQFVLVAILVGREQREAPLVDGPRGALAPLSSEPAQRPRRWSLVARRDPADPRVHLRAGAARDRAGTRRPAILHAPRVGCRQGVPGRGLRLVRPHPRDVRLQHHARRRAPVPRVPPSGINGAFGRGDWVANGLLFAGYHLHVPWAIPGTLLDMFTIAYPTKRYRSAWIGIAVHGARAFSSRY